MAAAIYGLAELTALTLFIGMVLIPARLWAG
jgi:hypothetical protein